MKTVAILGAGTAGTALAQVAAGNGHSVRLWGIEAATLEEIRQQRSNRRYLPGISLHEGIEACEKLAQAIAHAEVVIISVPAQAMRTVARAAASHLRDGPLVLNVAKGLEEGTQLRMSQVLIQELGADAAARIASMGGPALAKEFVRGVATAVVVASEPLGAAATIQEALQNKHFKVEASADVVGVELGAAFKNPYAIALGMCDGLGCGANAKAFLGTLALAEMEALITALGGQRRTVYGLAGLGDLLTTGYSPLSRNRTFGEKLGAGSDWREFLRTQTVEGVAACRTGRELAARAGVRAALLEIVWESLLGEKRPGDALHRFLREFAYR